MALSRPLRVDEDLMAAAKVAGPVMSRSAAQQISHWARIGREIEASHAVSQADIAAVLTGTSRYDDLDERGQAVVRATWDEGLDDVASGIDLATEMTEAGQTWSEADPDGRVVTHAPTRRAR